MSRILYLKETSKFLKINIPFNEDDKLLTLNEICEKLTIKTHTTFYNSLFFLMGNIIYMEWHINDNKLWCSHNHMLSIFQNEYKMLDNEIIFFIEKNIKNFLFKHKPYDLDLWHSENINIMRFKNNLLFNDLG